MPGQNQELCETCNEEKRKTERKNVQTELIPSSQLPENPGEQWQDTFELATNRNLPKSFKLANRFKIENPVTDLTNASGSIHYRRMLSFKSRKKQLIYWLHEFLRTR